MERALSITSPTLTGWFTDLISDVGRVVAMCITYLNSQ